ncbi:hypothetical protein [Acinetobacter sp. ANC 4633]|uniref:hypothetical protein n=1 Tax=Acinetobacter sp. ANC 4633 TaxID=2529845 RepID=UPI0013F166FA|nr:hypothetical protein [Acinetobacter sp. ANC 4633]
MKIEYLKVMHDANVGDVKDVEDFAANVLIKTGVAKPCDEPKKASSKAKKEENPSK